VSSSHACCGEPRQAVGVRKGWLDQSFLAPEIFRKLEFRTALLKINALTESRKSAQFET
jgi:hypothetical protein